MKNITSILAISLAIMLFPVSCDSPLSDIEIDDPSMLNAIFLVEKTVENGSESEYATAILTDKNLGFVQLKKGSVKVNYQKMPYNNLTKMYQLNFQVKVNTEYAFAVELSDGKLYYSYVTTPDEDFGTVSLPGQVAINDDIPVIWTQFNPNRNIKLYYQIKDSDGTWHDVFESSVMDDGNYVIENQYINFPNTSNLFTEAKVKLVRSNEGEINSSFREGGIISNIIYRRTFDIIN